MKTDNLFKFVAVRAAVPTDEDNPFFPRGPAYSFDPGAIRPHETTYMTIVGPAKARRTQGQAMVESDDYFANNDDWGRLRPHGKSAREMISAQTAGPDPTKFQKKAGALLSEALGTGSDLARLLSNRNIQDMRKNLWLSYYATILAPELRPQHREELVTWITFFHLADLAQNNQESFMLVAANPWRVRPAVPLNFYKSVEETEAQPETPSSAESSKQAQKESLVADLGKLRQAKEFVEKSFNDKLRKFQRMQFKPQGGVRTDRSASDQGVGGANLLEYAPWRLQEKDFKSNQGLLQALSDISLDPLTRTVPDLLHSLEERMAIIEAKLHRLNTTSQVVGAGRALVRISRPVSGTGMGG